MDRFASLFSDMPGITPDEWAEWEEQRITRRLEVHRVDEPPTEILGGGQIGSGARDYRAFVVCEASSF
jgi:hypothetical protein